MIHTQRLLDRFFRYVSCGSESRHEREFCLLMEEEFRRLGVPFTRDEAAGAACQSDGWNLLASLSGEGEPILLSAHMDTVAPGNGIVPVLENGVIRSAGDTVLGSDDKSGVAAILEALESILEEGIPHRPVEILFSVCEELGLLGSQHADFSQVKSREAVVLDSSKTGKIIHRSTHNSRLRFTIHGKAAHAATSPEDGIHALKAAARAVDRIPCGHADEVTVLNVANFLAPGKTNVVSEEASFEVMIRSFTPERQTHWFQTVEDTVAAACRDFGASYDCEVLKNYPGINVPADLPIILRLKDIYRDLGVEVELASGYGGCDATWIAAQGIDVVNVGTGMHNVHGTDESIEVAQLERAAAMAYELMRRP